MKSITKKTIAILSLLLVLITSLPVGVFAKYINDMNSNAKFGVIAGSLAKYGHELHYADYDGQTYMVFCTQYGITSPNGGEYLFNQDVSKFENDFMQILYYCKFLLMETEQSIFQSCEQEISAFIDRIANRNEIFDKDLKKHI